MEVGRTDFSIRPVEGVSANFAQVLRPGAAHGRVVSDRNRELRGRIHRSGDQLSSVADAVREAIAAFSGSTVRILNQGFSDYGGVAPRGVHFHRFLARDDQMSGFR
jgi:hypothetical protein